MTDSDQAQLVADHHMRVDRISSTPKRVLIVVANPSTSTTLGWPVGFWGAELTHPYYELSERGVEVTIASPDGGKVEMDALSDPRDPSKWSAEDLVTMGFVNTPELAELLEDTPKLSDLDLDEFDAIALFFLAEYANMILVGIIATLMFLGGWLSPFEGIPGLEHLFAWVPGFVWLLLKTSIFLFMYLWIRATFPRYRYDQIMYLGWKVLIPVTLVWILVVALAVQLRIPPWF